MWPLRHSIRSNSWRGVRAAAQYQVTAETSPGPKESMCVTRLPRGRQLKSTSRCLASATLANSPARETARARHRVLRAASPRGGPRSVDRGCAGRNATSVKDVEPRQTVVPWWPSQYEEAKATPALSHERGTTGVRDHGMYIRSISKRERSAKSWAASFRPRPEAIEQGITSKFEAILLAEVRCLYRSWEAG